MRVTFSVTPYRAPSNRLMRKPRAPRLRGRESTPELAELHRASDEDHRGKSSTPGAGVSSVIAASVRAYDEQAEQEEANGGEGPTL